MTEKYLKLENLEEVSIAFESQKGVSRELYRMVKELTKDLRHAKRHLDLISDQIEILIREKNETEKYIAGLEFALNAS